MAFIRTIPAAEASGDVQAMYERQAGFWGYLPDYAKVFCHRPEVMERWGRMLAAIKRPVDARRLELVTFVAAHELRHSGCSLAHGQKLAELIGEDAVIALANGQDSGVLSDAEKDIVRFARRIARDASRITSGEVEALREKHHLSDAEIFDIAAIAASRSFFTKLLDALGSEPDADYMKLEDRLRRTLTVGRPIAAAAPETMGEAGGPG